MPHLNLEPARPYFSHKHCSNCGETKPITEFLKVKHSYDGYDVHCKVCTNARKQREKAARAVRAANIAVGNTRECNDCHKVLPIDDFAVLPDNNINQQCKDCARKHRPLTSYDYAKRYLKKKR